MINNVKYEISVFEILALMKQKWKVVVVFMLLFIFLCGGYKAVTNNHEGQQGEDYNDHEVDIEFYETYSAAQEAVPDSLKSEGEKLFRDRADNPVYAIDPYQCEYEQIVLRFEDEGNHDWTVRNWISSADNRVLFGDQESNLSDYKTTIISAARTAEEQTSGSDETAVQVLAIDGFNASKAADYLIKHFRDCSVREKVAIQGISKVHIKGYNENLGIYLDQSRIRLLSLYNSLDAFNKMDRYVNKPDNSQASETNTKSIVKYCFIGLILGFVLGAMFVTLDVFRKREVISARQIEDIFDLALLSDFSSRGDSSLDILNANLDVITDDDSTIMIVTDQQIKGIERISSDWTEKSKRKYIICTNIINDSKMIEALNSTEGTVIGVTLGKSRLEHIQRVVLRLNKLDQKVLGFVLL